MASMSGVQRKIPCIMESIVIAEPSSKRAHQNYRIVAGPNVRPTAVESDVHNSVASEKIDGTCVFISNYEGVPWLWARYDRKPNKLADRRFKKFQHEHHAWEMNHANGGDEAEPTFKWNLNKDLKDVPSCWIPALEVEIEGGEALPDEHGHIPGWFPIDPSSRQHCWHLNSVDLEAGIGVFLEVNPQSKDQLQIKIRNLADFNNCTLELIGTHINGNPYKIGSKKNPLHVLVHHGSIPAQTFIDINLETLKNWFSNHAQGSVEGIVWHCKNGSMFKIHRHHIGLEWPVEKPHLSSLPITMKTGLAEYEEVCISNSHILHLADIDGLVYESICDIFQNNI